jgi:hypothetical protein
MEIIPRESAATATNAPMFSFVFKIVAFVMEELVEDAKNDGYFCCS